MTFTVHELAIPATIDAADAADFVASIALRNEVEALGYGTRDLETEPVEMLPGYHDPDSPRRLFGVRIDGALVARAYYEVNVGSEEPVAWAVVEVLPGFRGRGIGTALAEHVEALAHDRRRLYVYVVSPEGEGERLVPPTGYGSVPVANPEVRFLLHRGFTLEQVERASRLALPLDDARLSSAVAAASAVSGDDYRLHRWIRRTPQQWLDDMALMFTRMSTEYPSANLEVTQDLWDSERVRLHNDREAANPRHTLIASALHVPSGHLVGYTALSVPPESLRAVSQEDTIVLAEHRGHRLGMLLKAVNLLQLAERYPHHPAVITYNAEENRPMLAVNEALGFVAIGYEGLWKRMLEPGPA